MGLQQQRLGPVTVDEYLRLLKQCLVDEVVSLKAKRQENYIKGEIAATEHCIRLIELLETRPK